MKRDPNLASSHPSNQVWEVDSKCENLPDALSCQFSISELDVLSKENTWSIMHHIREVGARGISADEISKVSESSSKHCLFYTERAAQARFCLHLSKREATTKREKEALCL